MDSSLRERFARLGPIRAVVPVSSGSPAVFVLCTRDGMIPRTVDGALVLARRGYTLLRAKRAMEALLETGRIYVELPIVEDPAVVVDELKAANIAAAVIAPIADEEVAGLRKRLGLTREEFAIRYGLEIESIRNWELGRRVPDQAARSYLRAIMNDPELVQRAYTPL